MEKNPYKDYRFSAIIPYKSGPKWEGYDNIGGQVYIFKTIIRIIDKMEPSKRGKHPIYYFGKKDGILYWKPNDLYGGDYVYERKDAYEILHKNGECKAVIEKKTRK